MAHMIGIPGANAEEIIGSLECAAQIAGCRAVLIIDAINEGNGRILWPAHLSSFLSRIERSPWIATVLSVRTPYEDIVDPDHTARDLAITLVHEGFADHEYNAIKTFFTYYRLELPSTPMLVPEYSNPLFLKTLCKGLEMMGEHRLPRGFHGLSQIFGLYIEGANRRLSAQLDFDPNDNLVLDALKAFSGALAIEGKRWIPRTEALTLVNRLLPGRNHSTSLYRGLITEGLLLEDAIYAAPNGVTEVVQISYERFADHLLARNLIETHVHELNPSKAFVLEAPLAVFRDPKCRVPSGIIESFCMQLPELRHAELTDLAPELYDRWGFRDIFRQSLIWRDSNAFTDATLDAIRRCSTNEHDHHDMLEVLLTCATLPKHPLNALFLDKTLRRQKLPDRDAWWSTFLHKSYQTNGAIDRLLHWTKTLLPNTPLSDESTDLCAITLAWMLTSSNRFLRDKTTKALVILLTSRLPAAIRLIERFSEIDDLYISERIYAVAYGVAMRCNDALLVGTMAQTIYDLVFTNGLPPPHILLRDYARGTVERALHLGADIRIDETLFRPPYSSRWPRISSKRKIELLVDDDDDARRAFHLGDYGRREVIRSVTNDDFATYVIGYNSDWLPLRLTKPRWTSAREREVSLIKEFSAAENKAWNDYRNSESSMHGHAWQKFQGYLDQGRNAGNSNHERASAKTAFIKSQKSLFATLTKEHAVAAKCLMRMRNGHMPPRFDHRILQRYIISRVFNLGWTAKRFGYFDTHEIRPVGREARKAERIGKKYQWIAYHEILAFMSDHFQFRDNFHGEESVFPYDGPWQNNERDIDPSCTLSTAVGGTVWASHARNWWCDIVYDDWGSSDYVTWSKRNDVPSIPQLLCVKEPQSNNTWLNLNGHLRWNRTEKEEFDHEEDERRDLVIFVEAFLVRQTDAGDFISWAKKISTWGRFWRDSPSVFGMFLGEYAWSAASEYFQRPYFGDVGWRRPEGDCPVELRHTSVGYSAALSSYDCSIDDSFTLRLPITDILNGMNLRWTGRGAEFANESSAIIAFDPTADAPGPGALLIREREFTHFLKKNGYTVCWALFGEKAAHGPGLVDGYYAALKFLGAYTLTDQGIAGFTQPVQHINAAKRGIPIVTNYVT
ncbi:MAG: AVAST type 2 anti-phage system protein Avs2 [Candidatus Hydrogenedentes bacterium]|nr:AVAST type 2 anti-phage system protein Avs2 [Candidatus Hydrogenedentota bacterium]